MKTPFLVLALVACVATAFAVSPPPDGGYPNQNTAEGENALFNADTSQAQMNTGIGYDALFSLTTGAQNTAVGNFALYSNTTGNDNTANGHLALYSNTTGTSNTATGAAALSSNTTGYNNTADGDGALQWNTTGLNNTALGLESLLSNATGNYNTAAGGGALIDNTTGCDNTAVGYAALATNSVGSNNTSIGFETLVSNTTGTNNTAMGFEALFNNATGVKNTALGNSALLNNTTGKNNTAVGNNALLNTTTGNNNTVLGAAAGSNLTTGSNNVYLGAFGAIDESNTIRIGRKGLQTAVFITGIQNAVAARGSPVFVNAYGQLGTLLSSARYKDNIRPMAKSSEAILSLKPVTFRYKKKLDPDAIPQFGLVAEDVAKVDPDLVGRDDEGKPYTVRYEAVNAMLLNEFLKAHQKIENQANEIAELKSALKDMNARLTARGL